MAHNKYNNTTNAINNKLNINTYCGLFSWRAKTMD